MTGEVRVQKAGVRAGRGRVFLGLFMFAAGILMMWWGDQTLWANVSILYPTAGKSMQAIGFLVFLGGIIVMVAGVVLCLLSLVSARVSRASRPQVPLS